MTHTLLGICPQVRSIEYHPDGTVKRVEYRPGAVLQAHPHQGER